MGHKSSKKCEKNVLISHLPHKSQIPPLPLRDLLNIIGVYNYFSYLFTRSLRSFLGIQPGPVLPEGPVLDHFPQYNLPI